MRDSTCAHDNHVFTIVVCLVELDNHVASDLVDVIDVTKNGLAHHVLTEDVVVNILHKCLHHVLVGGLKLLPDGVLLKLNMMLIIVRVTDHVSKDLN